VARCVGTAIYLAPDILDDPDELGHDITVDWWAFGVFLHLLMTAEAPFWSSNPRKMFEMIKNNKINWSTPMYSGLSSRAISLLGR
jgi:serine/threonine protein kinase